MTQHRHRRPRPRLVALDAARLLIEGGATELPTRPPSADPLEALTVAAAVTAQQIAAALRSACSSTDAQDMVVRAFERAKRFEFADGPTIGAAALLVDAVGGGDEHAIAETLVRCRSTFTDDDLLRGAASLVAAWNVEIAALIGIDPIDAHIEVVRWVGDASRQECRRRRAAAVGSNRPRPAVVELPSRPSSDAARPNLAGVDNGSPFAPLEAKSARRVVTGPMSIPVLVRRTRP